MKVRRFGEPLRGERLASVYPVAAADTAETWHRRLNLFTGRALTAPALQVEQAGRAGRFALRGQAVSSGIASGLSVALETETATENTAAGPLAVTRHWLHLEAGSGIVVTGEDVVVPRARRINVADIPVFAPAAVVGEGPDEMTPAVLTGEPVLARRLFPSLGELLRADAPLPAAGVLVLEPVMIESIGDLGETDECGPGSADPCEQDPERFAIEDWQLVDACRLVWYAWPTDAFVLPAPDTRWRNRLAWTVFDAERGRGPDAPLPWERLGTPIALLAFDTAVDPARTVEWDHGELSWTPLFVDRGAVARAGGRPRRRSALPGGVTNPFLWQARIEQLVGHIASLGPTPPADVAAALRHLPPVGLLPKDAIDARAGRNAFFPATWAVDAAPVPLEQLDVVVQESAGLPAYDLFATDEVRVYVPVPQVYFEPGLLEVLAVDAEFQATIDAFALRRDRWRTRRDDVRDKFSTLHQAIDGEPASFPTPDPDATPDEAPAANAIDPDDPQLSEPEHAYDTSVDAAGVRRSDTLERLRAELQGHPIRWRTPVPLTALPSGVGIPAPLQARVRFDDATQRLEVIGRLADNERDALGKLSTDAIWQRTIDALHARSQLDELSRLDELGLREFIALLERKVSAADDRIDFGFARVQTDIYRVRQLMLGSEAASRLATSPALAEIAQGESARATQESLTRFLGRMKAGAPVGSTNQPAGGGSTGGTLRAGATASFLAATLPGTTTTRGLTGGTTSLPITGVKTAEPIGTLGRADIIDAESLISGKLFEAAISPLDVMQQSPIVGKALDFRTVSVAERLKAPPATESKSFSVASKHAALSELSDMDLFIDDIDVPGFYSYTNGQLDEVDIADPANPSNTIKVPKERRYSLGAVKTWDLAREILFDRHDPDPANGDEAAFFGAGVRSLDHTVAALRLVEGRIQAYRNAIARCRAALTELEGQGRGARSRLNVVDAELAEARHDVSVSRALLAEEQRRVADINARRDHVIAEHVEFLIYRRPRRTDLVRDLPARTLDPAVVEPALPACLAERIPVPLELRQLVELLRDAPASWFPQLRPVFDRFDRLDAMQSVIGLARERAASIAPAAVATDASVLGRAVNNVLVAQRQVLTAERQQTASFDMATLSAASWAQTREMAVTRLALGDLLDARHGRADVARVTSRELDDIARVAACLYAAFGDVLPIIRLLWAERLSQYDAPVNLRNLASLPRWGDLEFLVRRRLQQLADWLFARVDARQPGAVGMINDIVRLALLLASHAPVDRILSGHVKRPAPAKPGSRIDLVVDIAKVRVGMQVQLFSGAVVVASGVVEDLAGDVAAARITHASEGAQLAAGAHAQFLAGLF
jgi:hypothetical protein